jgi:hypothetical protein
MMGGGLTYRRRKRKELHESTFGENDAADRSRRGFASSGAGPGFSISFKVSRDGNRPKVFRHLQHEEWLVLDRVAHPDVELDGTGSQQMGRSLWRPQHVNPRQNRMAIVPLIADPHRDGSAEVSGLVHRFWKHRSR